MSGRKLPRTRRIWIAAGVFVLVIGALATFRFEAAADRESVPFSDLLRDVQANQVKAVVAEGDAIEFERQDGTRLSTVAPQGYIALNPTFN